MAKYRAKQLTEIEAEQFLPPNQIPQGVFNVYGSPNGSAYSGQIWTIYGKKKNVKYGEWIIPEASNPDRFYALSDEAFKEQYEADPQLITEESSPLEAYLEKHYPKESKIWVFVRVMFYNDYHRYVMLSLFELLYKLDPQAHNRLRMKVLGGAVTRDVYYWLKHTDKALWALVKSHEDKEEIEKYFGIDFKYGNLNDYQEEK